MPSCSVRQCSARRSIDQPLLKLHRFPKKDILRRKWIERIGSNNINPRHKELYICSLHFDESSYNRTLELTRLRDDAVPTLNLGSPKQPRELVSPMNDNSQSKDFQSTISIDVDVADASSASKKPLDLEKHEVAFDMPSTSRDTHFKCLPTTSVQPSIKKNLEVPSKKVQDTMKKLKKLMNIVDEQRKKIKRQDAKIYRQAKKIMYLQEVITDLKKKYMNNSEDYFLLEVVEESGGSQDFRKVT